MQMDPKWMEGGAKSCNIMMMDCSDAMLYKTGNHQQYLSYSVIVDVLCQLYTTSPLASNTTNPLLQVLARTDNIGLHYHGMCQPHTKLASNFKL